MDTKQREPIIHELKIWPAYIEDLAAGRKTFEVRSILDRNFQVGDFLHLNEYDPGTRIYTGQLKAKIVGVHTGLGVAKGYAILSLAEIEKTGNQWIVGAAWTLMAAAIRSATNDVRLPGAEGLAEKVQEIQAGAANTQDTNSGAGSVGGVPVGWKIERAACQAEIHPLARKLAGTDTLVPDPTIYTSAVLERGTPILPEEAKVGDLFFWTTSHSAWTVSTFEKGEFTTPALERRYEYAWLRPHAAPPQESDKGRELPEPWNEESSRKIQALIEERDRAIRRAKDTEDRLVEAHAELAKARDEVEALREEVALTNEHEHQILQERNEARDELQTARDAYAELLQETKLTEEAGGAVARAYQERDEVLRELAQARAALLAYQEAGKLDPDAWVVETRGGNVIYWTSKDREIAEQVAASYDREAIPLYRHPPAPADVVTVPREEWEALRALFAAAGRAIHAASTGGRATLEEINEAWAGVCAAQIASRSSAQAEGGGR